MNGERDDAFDRGDGDAAAGGIIIRKRIAPLPEHRAVFVFLDAILGFVFQPFAGELDVAQRAQAGAEHQQLIALEGIGMVANLAAGEQEARVEQVVAAHDGGDVAPDLVERDVGAHERVVAHLASVLGAADLPQAERHAPHHERGDDAGDQQFHQREAAPGGSSSEIIAAAGLHCSDIAPRDRWG